MRSRPSVTIELSSSPAVAGRPLDVEVTLASRSETPVTRVTVTLHGVLTATSGAPDEPGETRRSAWLALEQSWEPGTLGIGEHRHSFRFDVPAEAPPTYEVGRCASTYALEVHVDIPWWPDRRVRFPVVVQPGRDEPPADGPLTFARQPEGPVGDELQIEATLDGTVVAPGGELRGAIAFGNVGTRTFRAVRVELVCSERFANERHVLARVPAAPIVETPADGVALAFGIAVPSAAQPTLRTELFELRWELEVRADVGGGADEVLAVPIRVARGARPARERTALVRRKALGRERGGELWAQVAKRLRTCGENVELDAAGGLHAKRGSLTLVVRRETRGLGMPLVARYAWPSLGLELRLAERRASSPNDARPPRSWTLDTVGQRERFAVHAREPAQARGVLAGAVLAGLSKGSEVQLGDEGASMVLPGRLGTAAALERALLDAVALLDALDVARRHVPPPARLAAALPAWTDLARRCHARLEVGRMWLHDARHDGEPFELGTTWRADGTLVGTVLRVPLSPPLDPVPRLDSPSLSERVRELWRGLAARLPALSVHASAVELLLPDVVTAPASLLPTVEALSGLARVLRGGEPRGPFR